MKKLSLIILIILCAVLWLTYEDVQQPAIKVGTNVWPGYEPLYLAENLGAYPSGTVHLAQYPSASDVITAFKNGEIDAASLTLDEVLLMKSKGFDVQVALVMDFSNGGDVIIAKPGITSLADLGDRNVGIEATALGAFVLCRAAELEGINCQNLNVVNMTVNEHEQGYLSNDVAAVATFEPIRTKLLAAGGQIIFDSSQIPGEIIDVLAIHPKVTKQQSNNLATLLDGWFKAIDFMQSSPQQAMKKMALRQQISAQEFEDSLTGLHIPSLAENKQLFSTKQLHQSATTLQNILYKSRLLDSKVDIDSLFNADPVLAVERQ